MSNNLYSCLYVLLFSCSQDYVKISKAKASNEKQQCYLRRYELLHLKSYTSISHELCLHSSIHICTTMERAVSACILTNIVFFMHSAHCMLTLLSCSARARLVEDSVNSMSKFPAWFSLAWHDVHSLIPYRNQSTKNQTKIKKKKSGGCKASLLQPSRGYTVI